MGAENANRPAEGATAEPPTARGDTVDSESGFRGGTVGRGKGLLNAEPNLGTSDFDCEAGVADGAYRSGIQNIGDLWSAQTQLATDLALITMAVSTNERPHSPHLRHLAHTYALKPRYIKGTQRNLIVLLLIFWNSEMPSTK